MRRVEEYWRKTRQLTLLWLVIWFVLTFVLTWFSRALNDYSFAGFPLGFYMSAQGGLLCYLVIIFCYNRQMRRLDAEYDADGG